MNRTITEILNPATLDTVTDTEKLAAIIETLAPGKDAPATAAALLDNFGSFAAVIEAPADLLQKVTTPATAQKLAALLPVFRAYNRAKMESPRRIQNRRDLQQFCLSLVMGSRNEQFWLTCVNSQCHVVGVFKIAEGSLSEVDAFPRTIVEKALNCNAHSVFLCHNHPGSTCAPSQEDLKTTLTIQRILGALDILVLDHMIIAGTDAYSMAQHNDLEFGARGRG